MRCKNAGFTNFHGVDPAPNMLRLAEDKKIYSSLFSGIITQDERLPCGDNAYDGLICISAITKGHLQPNPAIKEFCRIVKPGGYLAFTVYTDSNLKELMEVITDFISQNKLEIILLEKRYYCECDGVDYDCYFCLLHLL